MPSFSGKDSGDRRPPILFNPTNRVSGSLNAQRKPTEIDQRCGAASCGRLVCLAITAVVLAFLVSLLLHNDLITSQLITEKPLLPEYSGLDTDTGDANDPYQTAGATGRELWQTPSSWIHAAWDAAVTAAHSLIGSEFRTDKRVRKKKTGTRLGLSLLAGGDPSGAEAICLAMSLRDVQDVDTWVCLGESRLALFRAALGSPPSSLPYIEADRGIAYDRLKLARSNFETATSIDPTHPGARAGLGLSLLLLGTSNQQHSQYLPGDLLSWEQMPSSNQLLFDAILHLSASSTLLSPELQSHNNNDFDASLRNQQYSAALHNCALAYMALGDTKSAVQLLRRAIISFQPMDPLTSLHINLSGALVQCGEVSDAVLLLTALAERYCEVREQGGIGAFPINTAHSERNKRSKLCAIIYNNLAIAKELGGHRAPANTLVDEDGTEQQSHALKTALWHYNMANHWDRSLGVGFLDIPLFVESGVTNDAAPTFGAKRNGEAAILASANLTHSTPDDEESDDGFDDKGKAVESSQSSIADARFHHAAMEPSNGEEGQGTAAVESEANIKADAAGKETTSVEQISEHDRELPATVTVADTSIASHDAVRKFTEIPTDMKVALLSLENAALRHPNKARLWLALSRARTHAGDKAGAVEAAAKGMSAAVGKDEMDAATAVLEDALDRLANTSNEFPTRILPHSSQQEKDRLAESGRTAKQPSEVNVLRLQLEIQSLKLQLLEKTIGQGREYGRLDPLLEERNPLSEEGKIDLSSGNQHQDDGNEKEHLLVQETADSPSSDIFDEKTFPTKTNITVESNPDEHNDGNVVADKTLSDLPGKAPASNFAVKSIPVLAQDEHETSTLGFDETEPKPTEELKIDIGTMDSGTKRDTDMKEENESQQLELPALFNPPQVQPEDIPAVASSYMKMADAYMDKKNYKMASKQFSKVIKKAKHHLPALIGYATALEHSGRTKQAGEVVLAYANATGVAVSQGDGMAEAILRRALFVAKTVPNKKIEVLKHLLKFAHTDVLAADIHFELGLELIAKSKNELNRTAAVEEFNMANAFLRRAEGNETACHGKSMIELGKISLHNEGNAKEALQYFSLALAGDLEESTVEALTLSGQAKKALGNVEAAIEDYRRALDLTETRATAETHHHLALALLFQNGDKEAIANHFAQALDMGMDLSPEAISVLGEHNLSVIRSANRAQWAEFNKVRQNQGSGGGVLSGSGLGTSNSVFAPRKERTIEASTVAESLALIEQGAASYDGSLPTGGDGDSNLAAISRKSRV